MQNRMKEYKGEQDFKPILQRLSMALADVEAGNNSESLLNEIRQITAQKMKFSMKDFFSKCDQICKKLRIWSHLLKKSLMENFIF